MNKTLFSIHYQINFPLHFPDLERNKLTSKTISKVLVTVRWSDFPFCKQNTQPMSTYGKPVSQLSTTPPRRIRYDIYKTENRVLYLSLQ